MAGMKRTLAATAVLAAVVVAALAASSPTGVTRHRLVVGGVTRTYEIESSANVVAKPALIVMLHGHGGTGDQMRRYKDMGAVTGTAAVIAYPDGIARGWNDGRDARETADDIGFLRRLIATTQAQYRTDPKRVYVAGMSNGAMMALRVACQMPEVTAVAAVSGGMPFAWKDDCKPAHPISLLAIDGTADPIVPFEGGGVFFNRHGRVLSAAATVAMFRAIDSCGQVADPASTPVASDGTSTSFQVWRGCIDGTSVAFAAVRGGGHGWPGAAQYLPKRLVGTVSQSLDANAYVWDFFRSLSSRA
jgi:polyhydroxybutyrate depolymerase